MFKNVLDELLNISLNDKGDVSVLKEEPIPSDWDASVFDKSFKKRLEYALERAKKIGQGSSRVVFEIEFEGRPTVLKIAKNGKGLAQNETEADYGLYRMYPDITVPLIDHDEEHDPPRWIHVEKADKITTIKFRELTGFPFDYFGFLLNDREDDREGKGKYAKKPYMYTNWEAKVPEDIREEIRESELFNDVTDMMGNFDKPAGDFTAIQNWGVYKGRPVIIDIGLSSDVWDTHYKPKPKPQPVGRW